MLNRLCEPPSIPLSFSLRPYSPAALITFASPEITQGDPKLVPSFTARTTGVSNPVCPLRLEVKASVGANGLDTPESWLKREALAWGLPV